MNHLRNTGGCLLRHKSIRCLAALWGGRQHGICPLLSLLDGSLDAGRDGYRVRQEFPSTYHQTYIIYTCQENMALEIMSFNASDELRLNNMTVNGIRCSLSSWIWRAPPKFVITWSNENDAKLSTCVTGLGTRMSIVPITTSELIPTSD